MMRFLAALLCAWPAIVWAGGNSGPNGGTSCAGFTDPNCAFLDISQSFTKGQAVTPFALTDAATITVDASQSNEFTVTLGGNRTLANPTNLKAGQVLTFTVTQDGTGGRTLGFGANYNNMAASAFTVTLNSAAGVKTTFSCNADTTSTMQCAGGTPVTSLTLGSTPLAFGATTTTVAGLTLTSPTLTTPALGTPASGVGTNLTGTAVSLTAGTANALVSATKLSFSGSAPVVSACGGSPAIDGNATNFSGTITFGSATATCTVTFASSGFTTFNHCRVTFQSSLAAEAYSYTKTVLTITATALSGSADYSCDGV